TGGIASGKSTVGSVFKSLGAHLIDADEIVRDIVEEGTPVWQEIVELFGKNVLKPNGSIDRTKLGALVFRDEEKRRALENIIHPRVYTVIEDRIKEIQRNEADAIVVLDIPLLIETGYHKKVNKVVLVYVDRRIQLERLIERGLSESEAEERIDAQIPMEEKKAYADYIIDGSSRIEDLKSEVRRICNEI
ncbi:MAG: dephospho-CoA kinase, partial [Nitrospirota bacterium]